MNGYLVVFDQHTPWHRAAPRRLRAGVMDYVQGSGVADKKAR